MLSGKFPRSRGFTKTLSTNAVVVDNHDSSIEANHVFTETLLKSNSSTNPFVTMGMAGKQRSASVGFHAKTRV